MKIDPETVRKSYQPNDIKVLFVGESAPVGPDFFYFARGLVYSQFRQVLAPQIGQDSSFLISFQNANLYLDDLVLEPINNLSRSDRRAIHHSNIPFFSKRLKSYQPSSVVCFMKAVSASVEVAMNISGVHANYYSIPFPGFGQQRRFREQLSAILPDLGIM